MEQSTTGTAATKRPRKRASEACAFCRKRKIKCTTERPTCTNCKIYGKDCVYEPVDETQASRPKKPRQSEKPLDNARSTSATTSTSTSTPAPTESREARQPSVSRIVTSANGMSSYHGRTSALFEESSYDHSSAEARPKMPEEWTEKGLVAEAARQRQLENINFRQAKLDFDGVDPELGMHLLSLHWNRQHHSFLITYRPAFMRDMACGGSYFSKLLLNAIYFGASKFSPRLEVRRDPNDVRTAGWRFRERVRELLGGALDKSEITTIQALLVMTNSLFALGDERSAAWLYAGIAFRMLIDLGLHIDDPDLASTRRFSDEDIEIRRRVLWGAFVVDKIQSLYQGRQVTIKPSDIFVPMKFLDTFEEYEDWAPFAFSNQTTSAHPGCPSYSVSTFRCLCQLSIVLSDILSSIYDERSFEKDPEELSSILETLHSKLTAWQKALPKHLAVNLKKAPTALPPHGMSLHAMYNVIMILLHRPFVADGHLYNTSRAISVNSFLSCATAASNIVHILRAYHKAFSVRRAPYLISYATYVAATIHARIAAKQGPENYAIRRLYTCLAVFRENQETNWAVRRANTIVQGLMRRLGVRIPQPDEIHLEESFSNNSNRDTPTETPSGSVQDDGSVQSLDIDGIIQSFAREQDGGAAFSSTNQPRHAEEGAHAQKFYQHQQPPAYLEHSSMMQPQDGHAGDITHMQSTDWSLHDIQPIAGAATVSIDDLLYGFNGSALDSFPMFDWEPS